MKFHMRTAMRDALSMVRKANVATATSIIKAALLGGFARPNHSKTRSVSISKGASSAADAERRPLGEAIRALRNAKSSFHRAATKPDAGSPSNTGGANPGGEGEFSSHTFAFKGGNLSYMLYVPPHVAGRDLALVLMLHGCNQNPRDFANGTQMNRIADEFGLIIAYPEQPRTANMSGCWNWFDGKHQKRGSGEPEMLAGLAQKLAVEFDIEATRVFAAGLSAGGAMAEILASTYPQEFAAVGIHSGLPYGAANSVMSAFGAMKGKTRMVRQTSAKPHHVSRKIIFHGASDATVHPSNGERIAKRTHELSNELNQSVSTVDINGRKVTRTLIDDNKGRRMTEHWVVKGGGHAWFGGSNQGSYTETKGPDASREMVRFFLEK